MFYSVSAPLNPAILGFSGRLVEGCPLAYHYGQASLAHLLTWGALWDARSVMKRFPWMSGRNESQRISRLSLRKYYRGVVKEIADKEPMGIAEFVENNKQSFGGELACREPSS